MEFLAILIFLIVVVIVAYFVIKFGISLFTKKACACSGKDNCPADKCDNSEEPCNRDL